MPSNRTTRRRKAQAAFAGRHFLPGWSLLAIGLLAAPMSQSGDDSGVSPSPTPGAARAAITAQEQAVLAFEYARRKAVVAVDIATLDADTAPGLVYVDAHGTERNKQDYLAHIATEGVNYSSYSLDDASAKVLGDLAVATGTFRFDVTVNGHRNVGTQYYTAVYVRDPGGWKLLIWHPTNAAVKAP